MTLEQPGLRETKINQTMYVMYAVKALRQCMLACDGR